MTLTSGSFRFDDGGSYVGEVEHDGVTVHGFGIARGRDGSGEFAGLYNAGYEQSGTFTSTSGHVRYEGQWSGGQKNGLGVETVEGWVYEGEWTSGAKGRYGVRRSTRSTAEFDGTWSEGVQDGYGIEKSADGGTYSGQWLRGLRHGYGIRQSATYEAATRSLNLVKTRLAGSQQTAPTATLQQQEPVGLGPDHRPRDLKIEGGGGFVLTEDIAPDGLRKGLGLFSKPSGFPKWRRKSLGSGGQEEELRRSGSRFQTSSLRESPVQQGQGQIDADEWSVILFPGLIVEGGLMETYAGEWKRDRRCGFGVGHRSDGLKYEGEWLNDKKFGYGRTTLPDGSKLEGKYKNNVLVSPVSRPGKGPRLFSTGLLGEKVAAAVKEAQSAADNAKQKSDIAFIRSTTALEKAKESQTAAEEAKRNQQMANYKASEKFQRDALPGNDLRIHRIVDATSVAQNIEANFPIKPTTETRTPSSTLSKIRLPFNIGQRKPGQIFPGEKKPENISTKGKFTLPWRIKPKIGEPKRPPIDRNVVSPGFAQPIDRNVVTPGFSQPIDRNVVTPGFLQPIDRNVFTPGFAQPIDRNVFTPGFAQPIDRNVDMPGFSQPIDRNVVTPGLSPPLDSGRYDDGVHLQQPFSRTEEKMIGRNEFGPGLNLPKGARGGHPFVARVAGQFVVPVVHAPVTQAERRMKGDAIKRELLEAADPKDAQHPRRNSLPSIIKEKTYSPAPPSAPIAAPAPTPSATPSSEVGGKIHPTVTLPPPPPPRVSHTETYVVDKGTRKRVKYLYEEVETVQRSPGGVRKPKSPSFRSPGAMGKLILSTVVTGFALSQSTPLRDWKGEAPEGLRKMYELESPTLRRKSKLGSASDVSTIGASEMMSREQVYVMSQRKREEIIQRRAEEARKGNWGSVVISLQDWKVVFVLSFLLACVMFWFYN